MKSPMPIAVLVLIFFLGRFSSISLHAVDLESAQSGMVVNEIHYVADLEDHRARVRATITCESFTETPSRLCLFQGELAILPPIDLPSGLSLIRESDSYFLLANDVDRFRFEIDMVVKITRDETGSGISLVGPSAVIGSVTARVPGRGVELTMLHGAILETTADSDVTTVRGFLGAEKTLALRWSHFEQEPEVARPSLMTVNADSVVSITPTMVKYVTRLDYEIVQGQIAQLRLRLASDQMLVRLEGHDILDWRFDTENDAQVVLVDFVQPRTSNAVLTVSTERAVRDEEKNVSIRPPQPLDVEREAGSMTLSSEDARVEVKESTGLRRVNADGPQAISAYRYNGRSFQLSLAISRMLPSVNVFVGSLLIAWRALLTLRCTKGSVMSLETSGRLSTQSKTRVTVMKAEQELAKGRLGRAAQTIHQARAGGYADGDVEKDLEELERKIRVAQASNLMNHGDSDHDEEPSSYAQAEVSQPVLAAKAQQAAESQWTRLRQAQELIAAEVHPLRVNLPFRGLRHAFAQTLQTETDKAMTIAMTCTNLEAGRWKRQAFSSAAMFLVLWRLLAWITVRRRA